MHSFMICKSFAKIIGFRVHFKWFQVRRWSSLQLYYNFFFTPERNLIRWINENPQQLWYSGDRYGILDSCFFLYREIYHWFLWWLFEKKLESVHSKGTHCHQREMQKSAIQIISSTWINLKVLWWWLQKRVDYLKSLWITAGNVRVQPNGILREFWNKK